MGKLGLFLSPALEAGASDVRLFCSLLINFIIIIHNQKTGFLAQPNSLSDFR